MGLLWFCIQIPWFYYGKCPTTWIYHGTASKYSTTMVNNMVSYIPKKLGISIVNSLTAVHMETTKHFQNKC